MRHTKNKQDLINSSSNKDDSNLIELAIKQQKQSQLLDLDKIPKVFIYILNSFELIYHFFKQFFILIRYFLIRTFH